MQITRRHIHEHIYYYGLLLIAASLPVSVFMVNMLLILLVVNFLAACRYREKWERIAQNRALQVLLLFFFIHVVGLLWTENLAFGLKLLKIKLPILIFPVVIAASPPLGMARIRNIVHLFSLSVLLTSIISILKLAGLFQEEVLGYRELSPFVHHLRYAVMLVTAMLFAIYFLFFDPHPEKKIRRLMYILILVWLPVFSLALKSLTGILVMGSLGFLILLRVVFYIKKPAIRFLALVPLIMLPLGSLLYVNYAIEKFYSFDELVPAELESHTAEGNPYVHKPKRREVENGHYVWIYVSDKELEREWNRVSDISYDGRNLQGEKMRYTIIRYLTSKGLRKDAAGFRQLTEDDIRAIEQGKANHIYLNYFSLYPRIYEVIWEFYSYKLGYEPNGKSILQRYLYLQSGWAVASDNLLIGVGTGDELLELGKYYEAVDSPLSMTERRGPHNEFLSAIITLGIPGFIVFMCALVFPLFLAHRQSSYMATGFLLLILISMLTSGTLSSSTGASLTGLFYSLFLFGPSFPWLSNKDRER